MRVAGIDLAEIDYSAGLRLPPHAHDSAGFCLVLHGSYVEDYRARELSCRAHSVTFSPAGAEHRNAFDAAPVRCFTIEVSQPFFDRFEGVPLREPFEQHGGMLAMLAHRLLHEYRHADDASPLAIEGLVLEMIAAAARDARDRSETRVSAAIRRVRDILDADFAEPVHLADIASAVGRHPVYIAIGFRHAYGETIGEYVRRRRVEYARNELECSELPISEIALAAGFADQSHFTRAFHKATGITPAAYRALIADNRH